MLQRASQSGTRMQTTFDLRTAYSAAFNLACRFQVSFRFLADYRNLLALSAVYFVYYLGTRLVDEVYVYSLFEIHWNYQQWHSTDPAPTLL